MKTLALLLTSLLLIQPAIAQDNFYQVTGIAPTDTLNVRAAASTTAAKVGVLEDNSQCLIVESSTKDWHKIKFKDGSAYVYSRYLKKMADASTCEAERTDILTLEEVARIKFTLEAQQPSTEVLQRRERLATLSAPDYLIEISKHMCSKSLLDEEMAATYFFTAAHNLFNTYQSGISDHKTAEESPLVRILTQSDKGEVIADFFAEHEGTTSCRVVLRNATDSITPATHDIDTRVARFMRMGGRLLVATEEHTRDISTDEAPYAIKLRYYGSNCKDIYLKTIVATQGDQMKSSAIQIALSGSLPVAESACLPLKDIH